MADVYQLIKQAQDAKWSGELKIRVYFGDIKNVKISATVDPSLPVDIRKFKQKQVDK